MLDSISKTPTFSDIIALLSNDQLTTIALSKIKTLKNIKTLKGHSDSVGSVNMLPNGHVISGSQDSTLKVWDIDKGTCLSTLQGHSSWVTCAAVLPNGQVISGSGDKTLKVWDIAAGTCLNTLQGHSHTVCSIAVLPNGDVVSGSYDQTLKVWDLAKGTCLSTLRGHSSHVSCVAALPNGHVVSGSNDFTLKVWDIAKGTCLSTLQGHSNPVSCVAVLPNGHVISGSQDSTLKVWDIAKGTCLTLKGHDNVIWSITVLANGQVISGSKDTTLKVWQNIGLSLQEQIKLLPLIEKNTSLIQLDLSNIYLQELFNDIGDLLTSLFNNKKIEVLELSNTGLTDLMLNKCFPTILSVPFKKIDLSNNKLTYNGIRVFFDKLYNSKNHNVAIQEIKLNVNLIEIDDMRKLEDLYNIYSDNEYITSIDLSGNFLLSSGREKKLIKVLTSLLNKSGLTVDEFLSLRFRSLKKTDNSHYALELKKENGESVKLQLNYQDIHNFNQLKEFAKESTENDVFEYITSQGIGQRILEIDDELKAKKYNALVTLEEKKALVKQLIDYHPQAPLKSHINTHPHFFHSPFTQAQSLLCREHKITHEIGRIYLLAKIPKKHMDEHAMIAYEFISGHNQRFFKVAHLTAVRSNTFFGMDIPSISFYIKGIDELIPYLEKNYYIASFSAERKQIKAMHASIVEDVIELKNTKYKFMTSSSTPSQKDSEIQIKNCFTWAWDKITDYAGYKIDIKLSIYPSEAVKLLSSNPDKVHTQVIKNEGVPEKQAEGNCLIS